MWGVDNTDDGMDGNGFGLPHLGKLKTTGQNQWSTLAVSVEL